MTLEKAYKIGLKYGFTFNGVGPSLSVVDGKVGICINLLDNEFGYIKRNYSFDDADEFEEFLKRYNYYLHNRKEKDLYLTLDNYEEISPKIIYSYEVEDAAKEKTDHDNKMLVINDMKSFLNNYVDSIDSLRKAIAEKILIEQDYYNKLQYYKDLLCKAYDTENEEEALSADKEELNTFNEKVKEFDLNHKRTISSIDVDSKSFEELDELYKELYQDCKEFLNSEEFISLLYDKLKFKNNIDLLDQMIDYLIKNPVATDETEEELNIIKEAAKPIPELDDFKETYKDEFLYKYEDVEGSYNEAIFDEDKIEFEEYESESSLSSYKIEDLKSYYDELDEEEKTAVGLVHSPIKKILLHVIEQAYFKNKKFNFEREDFKNIYESLANTLKNSNNLVFKIKYFKCINFNDYEEFIKSIVKTAKVICTSFAKLPHDLKLYSLNYDACMICASDSPIKSGSEVVNVINAKKGCSFLYSPTKIVYNESDDSLSIADNKNVVYLPRYLNDLGEQDKNITLNLYEESFSIDKVKNKNLLIVDNFVLDKSIKYKFSDMTPKE